MIICAAIKISHTDIMGNPLEDLIVCGHRHGNCYQVEKYLDLNILNVTEGFITNKGAFVDREVAYKHAINCGQLTAHNKWYRKDNKLPNELYSEDLY